MRYGVLRLRSGQALGNRKFISIVLGGSLLALNYSAEAQQAA